MNFVTSLEMVAVILAGAATLLGPLLKWTADFRSRETRPTTNNPWAPRPFSDDPLQPGLDRLNDVRSELARQQSIVKINKWMRTLLTVGQTIIGGLLASSFVQQSLSQHVVGVLGLLVLLSSLIYQQFRPDLQLRGAMGRVAILREAIRIGEDALVSGYKSKSCNWLHVDFSDIRNFAGRNACESSIFSKRLTLRICNIV